MDNINHLNSSDYYNLPSYGSKRVNNNVEKQSTMLAVGVLIVFTIIAFIVC